MNNLVVGGAGLSSFINVAPLLIVSASTVFALTYFIWKSKFVPNQRAAARWILSFDITAGGQRYRGERSTQLYRFFALKDGLGGYRTKSLYRTVSGRYFEIDLFTELSEVTGWQLDAIDPDDAEAFLSRMGIALKPAAEEQKATGTLGQGRP